MMCITFINTVDFLLSLEGKLRTCELATYINEAFTANSTRAHNLDKMWIQSLFTLTRKLVTFQHQSVDSICNWAWIVWSVSPMFCRFLLDKPVDEVLHHIGRKCFQLLQVKQQSYLSMIMKVQTYLHTSRTKCLPFLARMTYLIHIYLRQHFLKKSAGLPSDDNAGKNAQLWLFTCHQPVLNTS